MAKQIYQYRFGVDENFEIVTDEETGKEVLRLTEEAQRLQENLMNGETGITLPDGTVLSNVEQISIESIPGITFFINDITTRIGLTGIFEVNFKEKVINKLYFSEASIMMLTERALRDRDSKGRNTKTMLIINVVYNN